MRFTCSDAKGTSRAVFWDKHTWPSAGSWEGENPIYDNGLYFAFRDHCSDTRLRTVVIPDGNIYATEHIIEYQTFPRFFKDAAISSDCNVDCDFFLNGFKLPIVKNAPVMPGGLVSEYPSIRITEALGSNLNRQNFVLLSKEINNAKSLAWALKDMSEKTEWVKHVADDNPRVALQKIRNTIAVFNYLNHPYVRPKFKTINRLLREELRRASDAYNLAMGKNVDLAKCWDEWFANHMNTVVTTAKDWVTMAIKAMRDRWRAGKNPNDEDWVWRCLQVNEHLDRLERLAFTNGEIHFDTADMY